MSVRFSYRTRSLELIQPSESPFDYPSPSPQSAAMFCVAFCKKRDDAFVTQTLPDRLSIVTKVAQYAVWTMPRATPPSLQAWDSIHQCEGLL